MYARQHRSGTMRQHESVINTFEKTQRFSATAVTTERALSEQRRARALAGISSCSLCMLTFLDWPGAGGVSTEVE